MSAAGDEGERDLAEFYAATYPRLVGVVGAVGQNRDEAEEVVQDAFLRLMGQWSRVSVYDDPEAWVRKVALGFLGSRRRKIRNGMKAVLRLGVPEDQDPPTGDAVDLRRALRSLSQAHREVIVLQDLGLSVDDIARHLDLPSGTVKSRLSRARAALAPLLREDVNGHV